MCTQLLKRLSMENANKNKMFPFHSNTLNPKCCWHCTNVEIVIWSSKKVFKPATSQKVSSQWPLCVGGVSFSWTHSDAWHPPNGSLTAVHLQITNHKNPTNFVICGKLHASQANAKWTGWLAPLFNLFLAHEFEWEKTLKVIFIPTGTVLQRKPQILRFVITSHKS